MPKMHKTYPQYCYGTPFKTIQRDNPYFRTCLSALQIARLHRTIKTVLIAA